MNTKTVPKKKDGSSDIGCEIEQTFILRLPQDTADELRQEVQSGSAFLKDRLSIEMDADLRRGHVRFNNTILATKVVDLPCIVECMKTVDKKNFYKTANICQMMVPCTTDDEVNVEDVESPKKKEKDKRYLYNHGLTPPLKNVRKRRFRKTLKKKYMDQPELEKEVRRLFRYDSEALDVKWEVLTEDEKPLPDAGQSSGLLQSSGTVNNAASLRRNDSSLVSMDITDFFGELSSSEGEDEKGDEEKDEEEKDVNIMDSGEDDASRLDSSLQPEADMMSEAQLREKLQDLEQQLEEYREKRLELESQIAEEDNDMMIDSLREVLERYLQEESEKEKEKEILSSMLSQ